jgi:putative transposase
MPRKTKTTVAAEQPAQLQIPSDLLDQIVTGPMTAGQVQGLFDQFKKAVLERALGAEMSHHLGYAPGQCHFSP